jgi:regulator of protease activity HflC (stomatin/prohibitin superfamily)
MSIGDLFGIVAVAGFGAMLLGIALIVVNLSQNRPFRALVPLVVAGVLAGILFSLASAGVIVVAPQEVAVVFQTFSGELDEPRNSGTHVIIPVLQEASIYPINFQQVTMAGRQEGGGSTSGGDDPVQVRTIDGQEVLLDVTLIYRINPAEVNTVHRNWQRNYEQNLVIPVLRGFVRDVVSGYRAEAVYGESREAVQRAIEDAVSTRLAQEGFEVTDLIVRNVTFSSEEFAQSIERVQIAERQAEEAAFRVQQEEQEAARVRVRAEGARDATIAEAEGEAESVRLLAQAQADALALVSEQLSANPLLIQYEYVRNLSDNVTLIALPSNSPFLFDFESLLQSLPPAATVPDSE